ASLHAFKRRHRHGNGTPAGQRSPPIPGARVLQAASQIKLLLPAQERNGPHLTQIQPQSIIRPIRFLAFLVLGARSWFGVWLVGVFVGLARFLDLVRFLVPELFHGANRFQEVLFGSRGTPRVGIPPGPRLAIYCFKVPSHRSFLWCPLSRG